MKSLLKSIVTDILIYLLLCIAVFLMAKMIVAYSSMQTNVGFLQQKQDYLTNKIWLTAFYVHVFTSVFCLFAGFTQFSRYILKNKKVIHKVMGSVYAFNILFINFPAGLIMAIYANGELPSKIAFMILDCLWFFFTLKAITSARKKQFVEHKEYMIRSYALTLSAITLRSWKIVLVNLTLLDLPTIYMIDAWLGFVPNLLFAEFIIKRERSRKKKAKAIVQILPGLR